MSIDWIGGIVLVFTVLLLGIFGARALDRRIAARRERPTSDVEPTELSRQRVRTVQRVLKGILAAFVVILAVAFAADAVGIGIGPFIFFALIWAVVIAFSGAAWGSDIVAGISIVLEGQYFEGDWVEIKRDGIEGKIESLSLRATTIRSLDGTRWVIPNGEMRIAGNRTYDYSRYIFVLRVSYEDDVGAAFMAIEEAFDEMRAEPRWAELTDRLRILGVDEYGTSGIDIKMFLNARPGEQWRVGREFRRRLLPALDRVGVRIPYEHREVILRPARSGAKDAAPR